MTDTERRRVEAICEVAGVSEIDDLSDGFHTFRQLYYQRMMLFAAIVKQNKERAWKSLKHEDGELCFGGGWFIVGIDTPEGSYTYHYEDSYFSLFVCEELERGKHWDGHTEADAETRLMSLPSAQPEQRWISCSERLPENGRQVLVYAISTHFALAKYDEMREADGSYKKQWVTFDAWKPFYTVKNVIAWRELPEPYRGEEE